MPKRLILLALLIPLFYSCSKDNDPSQEPDDPGTTHPVRIVEIASNNDSIVASLVYNSAGQISSGTLIDYISGSIDVSATIQCSYYPCGLLKSATSSSIETGTGYKQRIDIVPFIDDVNGLVKGIRYSDSAEDYTVYDKYEYDNNKHIIKIFPVMDSARYFNTPPDYPYKDSLIYAGNNLAQFVSYTYDPLTSQYVEFSRETIGNYDNKVKYLTGGIASFVLFDFEHLISANNEGSISFSDSYGNSGAVTTSIEYDDKNRPTRIVYSGAADAFSYGIFIEHLKERRVYY